MIVDLEHNNGGIKPKPICLISKMRSFKIATKDCISCIESKSIKIHVNQESSHVEAEKFELIQKQFLESWFESGINHTTLNRIQILIL